MPVTGLTMPFTVGYDYAWDHPLLPSGVKFVCRYLSHDPTKNLTKSEVALLRGQGLHIVANWESTADRMKGGYSAGRDDASAAVSELQVLGMARAPLYFSCDWDATPGEQGAINAYLDGAASVIGRARTGVYGGFWATSRALTAGKAARSWQTFAWSSYRGGALPAHARTVTAVGGHDLPGGTYLFDTRAALWQGTQLNLGGKDCDVDEARLPDYGQFPPYSPPPVPATRTRYVADGHKTLREVAVAGGHTFQQVAGWTIEFCNDKNRAAFKIYYDRPGGADTIMPKGLVYWY